MLQYPMPFRNIYHFKDRKVFTGPLLSRNIFFFWDERDTVSLIRLLILFEIYMYSFIFSGILCHDMPFLCQTELCKWKWISGFFSGVFFLEGGGVFFSVKNQSTLIFSLRIWTFYGLCYICHTHVISCGWCNHRMYSKDKLNMDSFGKKR